MLKAKQSVPKVDVVWQYKPPGGEWTTYPDFLIKKIEAAYLHKKRTVVVQLGQNK